MLMKAPPSETPNLDDILARDFAELKAGEANLIAEAPTVEANEAEEAPSATPSPIVYNQRIDAVEDRTSFAVPAPASAQEAAGEDDETPPTAPQEVLKAPTTTLGDDFDVDW